MKKIDRKKEMEKAKGFINELGYNALLGPNIFREWLYECFKNFKKSCF